MINSNEVFTRISKKVKAEFGNSTFVVGERVVTPSKYPCVWVVEMDTYPDQRYINLDMADEQRQSIWEVQAFSNLTSGGTTQAKKLIECVTNEMKSMGYRCITSAPIDNAQDSSIKRHIARYRRILGGDDVLPQ